MSEQLEVQIARMQERMIHFIDGFDEHKQTTKDMEQEVLKISVWCRAQDRRMDALEQQFADASPTISEFITLKQQAIGAGRLGKALWVTGGVLIGAAYYMREKLLSLIH